jgi:hypothetical protein
LEDNPQIPQIPQIKIKKSAQSAQSADNIYGNAITYRTFERFLRRLIQPGWKPILLLDEFERMSHNPHLDPDFFSGLRALATRYPIAYVTASKHPLLELTYANASTLSSPFFNIFASIRLGLFAEAESRDLLAGLSSRGQVTFAPATIEVILDLAGPHPWYLIQPIPINPYRR